MANEYIGRVVNVKQNAMTLFSIFSDLKRFEPAIPADKRDMVHLESDTLLVNFQGFELGARIVERVPYSKIICEDYAQKVFPFRFTIFIDQQEDNTSNIHLELSAELNVMTKMMLGNKLQELIDKLTDQIELVSRGRMPENFN